MQILFFTLGKKFFCPYLETTLYYWLSLRRNATLIQWEREELEGENPPAVKPIEEEEAMDFARNKEEEVKRA